MWIGGMCRVAAHQQDVAVIGDTRDVFGRDNAVGARPVLDNEWLAELARQPLGELARRDVGAAAGRGDDHQGDCAGGISGLGGSDRNGQEHGCAGSSPKHWVIHSGRSTLTPTSLTALAQLAMSLRRAPIAQNPRSGTKDHEPAGRIRINSVNCSCVSGRFKNLNFTPSAMIVSIPTTRSICLADLRPNVSMLERTRFSGTLVFSE